MAQILSGMTYRLSSVCASALVVLLMALLFSNFLMAQKRTAKKPPAMLTITHPVSKIKLTFHDPALLEKSGEVAAWRKLTIKLPDDEFTIEAGATNGYMVDPNVKADRSWSPDGRYIALYRAYSIADKQTFSGISLVFLNLDYGEEVDFKDRTGGEVTKDNFYGWAKNKPHRVQKGTAKAGVFIEALPNDEPAVNQKQ